MIGEAVLNDYLRKTGCKHRAAGSQRDAVGEHIRRHGRLVTAQLSARRSITMLAGSPCSQARPHRGDDGLTLTLKHGS